MKILVCWHYLASYKTFELSVFSASYVAISNTPRNLLFTFSGLKEMIVMIFFNFTKYSLRIKTRNGKYKVSKIPHYPGSKTVTLVKLQRLIYKFDTFPLYFFL